MNNRREPKVSILLAVYNGEHYLQEAINSVRLQTYSHWELLIVDNGSDDSTKEIAVQSAIIDDRIKFYALTEKGKTRAYNFAFEKSTGDFICFFAADDILTPQSIEKRLSVVREDNLTYSTCLLETFSEDPAHHGIVFPKNNKLPNFSGGSIFFTRELAKKTFPIPITLPNEDTWTSLHLRAFAKNVHFPEVLYLYRIHNSNSYGYDLTFIEKRTKYLQRMEAFVLFKEKWINTRNIAFDQYITYFIKGLSLCKNNRRFSILFLQRLPKKDKMVLFFYSSSIIYEIRHKFFKFFSGILH